MLAGPGRGLMEPYAVELKDGRLLMLMRTQTHRQYRSISPDGGDSWSPATEVTPLVSPESPAAIRRDPGTGWLTVVWNNNSRDKHGPDRTPLTIAFSDDEGESWFGYLNLETDHTTEFSYPSLRFIDGKVFVTYYERQVDPTDRRISLKMRSFNISAPGLTARAKSHAGGVTRPWTDCVLPSCFRKAASRSALSRAEVTRDPLGDGHLQSSALSFVGGDHPDRHPPHFAPNDRRSPPRLPRDFHHGLLTKGAGPHD